MSTTSKPFNLILVTIFAALLSACANLGDLSSATDIAKPKISLANTTIKQLSMDKVDLNINLNIDNPNPVGFSLAGFDYELIINEQLFTKGTQTTQTQVAASSVSTTAIPLTIVFSELAKIIKDVKNMNEVDYEIKTTARVDLPLIGAYPINSSDTGKLPIPKLPKISVENIALDKLNFTSADVLVKLNIENPNVFDIDISKLLYNLNVAGNPWGSASLNKPIQLKRDASNEIEIPINLSLMQLGGSLIDSLTNQKPMSYRINGDMLLNTSLPLFKNVTLPFDYSSKTK